MVETEVQGEGSFLGCASSRVPGKNATFATSDHMIPRHCLRKEPYLRCPECGSPKTWKDGLRYSPCGDSVQRWLCRNCGHRFTEPGVKLDVTGRFEHVERRLSAFEHVEISHTEAVKATAAIVSSCQICEKGRTKNLASVEKQEEKIAGTTTKPDDATIKGLLAQYLSFLENQGYSKDSCYPHYLERLVRVGTNLLDPEDVKKRISRQPWRDGVKMLAVQAYSLFTVYILKKAWEPPYYKQEETIPFVPEEKELEQLIGGCRSKRMAAFLQALKETYADPGEILRLEWVDVDSQNNVVTINHPVKGHNCGQYKVNPRLIAMLNALPRKSERVFSTSYQCIRKCYIDVRKRIAQIQQNPRILQIHFTTFRHWGGSMLAHFTNGNVPIVQKMLRHKSVLNTMKYIHMVHYDDKDFDVAAATTVEDIKQLALGGFQKFDELNGVHIFRRPKRFNA